MQSRYYNPEIGRFINADAYVSTGQGFVGNNMFAYCGNNPLIQTDPSGEAHTDIFPVYWGQGEYPEIPTRLYIPNAKRTETVRDMVQVTVDFFAEILNSEPVHQAGRMGKTATGAYTFTKNALNLFSPDPIPVFDEIWNLWQMTKGLVKMLHGISEIIAEWMGVN